MTLEFNTNDFIRGLEAAARRMLDDGNVGLSDAAEYILGVSVQRVPIEEGTLSGSGRTEVQDGVAAIGYGSGASAPYAVKQHEDPTLHHDAGRTHHYLSGPMIENQQQALTIIANRMKQ